MRDRIELLKKADRKTQKVVYQELSPYMFAICRRYVPNSQDAEDVMIQGFFKAFTKIDQLKEEASLNAWIRRIMVTESLMFLRRNKKFTGILEISEVKEPFVADTALDALSVEEIFSYIEQLPVGYRTVFNLYSIEGYKHREIAEMLGISINTSKSQLLLARKKLRQMIEQNEKTNWRNGSE